MEEDKSKDDPLKSAESGGDPIDPATGYVFGTAGALVTGAVLLPTASDLATGVLIQPATSDRAAGDVPPSTVSSSVTEAVPPPSASSSVSEAVSPPAVSSSVSGAVSSPVASSSLTGAANSVNSAEAVPLTGNAIIKPPYVSSVSDSPAPNPDKFAVDEVVGFAWRSMLKYFWPLAGIMASNFLVQSVPAITVMVMNYTANSPTLTIVSMLISLVGAVLNLIIALGTIMLWLKICDGDTITIRDVYSKIPRVWHFMLATFLYGSMVLLGYICLIVPGLYLQIRFQFYPYFIAESGAGPIQSLKASYAITKGSIAELFFLSVVNYFIGWVGMMALFIGVFPALIIQNVALAKTYRQLRRNTPVGSLPPGLLPAPLIGDTEIPTTVAT